MSVKLKAEAAFQQIIAQSGTKYTADAAAIITGVAEGDVLSLLNAGCESLPGLEVRDNMTATTDPGATDDSAHNYGAGSQWLNTSNGKFWLCTDGTATAAVWALAAVSMGARLLDLFNVKLATGLQLAATAAAGVFGLSNTSGTSIGLVGEAANTNTKTDVGYINWVVPDNYTAAANLVVTFDAKYAGAGTPGTKTIDLSAYKMAADGTSGADICATNAQNLTNANALYAFTITGATLSPGDQLQLKFTTALQETGGTNINSQINSIAVAHA